MFKDGERERVREAYYLNVLMLGTLVLGKTLCCCGSSSVKNTWKNKINNEKIKMEIKKEINYKLNELCSNVCF